MKENPTLEDIKEMYPEGCEVSCAVSPDWFGVIHHDKLILEDNGDVYFVLDNSIDEVFVFWSNKNKFAQITKPAPQEKPTLKNELDKAIVNLIEVARDMGLRASVTFEVR